MRTATILLVLSMVLAAVAGSGCIAASDHDVVQCRPPTLGRELTDLSKARENGALTEKEYQDLHEKLISGTCRTCKHKGLHSKN